MYDDVLVPTDGSDAVRPAAEHALALAEPFDATVHALYVVEQIARTPVVGPADVVKTTARDVGRAAVADLEVAATDRGLEAVSVVREGRPYREIVDYAVEAGVDVVVMGTHARSGVGRFVGGSVTERVIRACPRPVLAVRRDDVRTEARVVTTTE